jgi:aminoglycoside phosphotransferase (APT) family kinase protein
MDHPLDFDARLPLLRQAFDRELVVQRFEQEWPAAQPAPRKVLSCRLQDTKYQPSVRCTTIYQLMLEPADGAPTQTIGVLEVSPQGLAHRLYSDDPRLPWLQAATDPAGMRERFATLLADQGGASFGECAVTPVRYHAGARCVFRYDLRGPAGERTLFGKLIGQGAELAMSTVAALHQASAAAPNMPRILQPQAFWPDLHLLVQPEVSGRAELNDLAFDPAVDRAARERWLHRAGQCLAGLHQVAGIDGPPRTLHDDLGELEEYIAPIEAVDAQLAARYGDALAAMQALAARHTQAAPVASHGAFRTDQFMIDGDELVMIDLDGFCWASPARDLGNYLAYLRWKQIRQPARAALIERAGELLLEGYRQEAPAPGPQELAIYEAASMLKIAGRRYRSLTVKEWHLVPALLDAAERTIAEQS